MKKYLSILMLCATQLIVSDPYLEPEVYKRYLVDDTMKALLDEHSEEIIKAFKGNDPAVCLKKRRVYEFPWLPGYLIKAYISRIIGIEKLKKCVKEHNLDLIVIPEKRIYVVDGHEFIIVPRMKTITARPPLTLKQVKQLWTIVEETGYNDMHDGNYLFLEDGKLAIIDTERRSFGYRRFKALARFLMSHYPFNYTEDALKFVLKGLVRYIPEDIHNIPNNVIAKKGKFSYPRIYERINNHLREGRKFDWDYYAFFKEHFPNPFS